MIFAVNGLEVGIGRQLEDLAVFADAWQGPLSLSVLRDGHELTLALSLSEPDLRACF